MSLNRAPIFALVIWLIPFAGSALAQSVEQSRRIEEGKREELKPTVAEHRLPRTASPGTTDFAPPAPLPVKEFYLMGLVQKTIAFRYDAAKAIVLLMGVDEEHIDLAAQVAYLQAQGFLPSRYRESFDPMEPLRKGVAAYMFREALGIRGGIALHLFGPSERFAMKELAFQGMMAEGSVNDLVSGEELVQIMGQAAAYKARRELPSTE